jgi:hypothetical protein
LTRNELGARVASFIACTACLALVLYLPVGWLVTRVAVPRVIARDVPPFAAGDVIIHSPVWSTRTRYAAGTVVVYRPPRVTLTPQGHTVYVVDGERIDRILAVEGESAVWEAGRLLVNGEASPWRPLNPDGCPMTFRFTVPEGYYLIVPSSLRSELMVHPDDAQWKRLCVVPVETVIGHVYLRQQPLSRFGWIR